MRTFFLTSAAIVFSATLTFAQDAQTCAGDGLIAKVIMTHRQAGGWNVNTMMEKFGAEPGLRAMVLDAYSMPAMQTAATRQAMINEFANSWSLKCYQDGPAISRKPD
ncbi:MULTISPECIES: hypothetical protein [unclassified Mameliella]|uniref:hypothetical protein n=1 Tax=unclassified Mameliella TaxID=2630630 RepID=UPI00273FEAB0|nr:MULTISPECIES: hypothetical protein [unclassified Mameliella]